MQPMSAISALQTGSRIWNARLLMRKLCTVLPQQFHLLTGILESNVQRSFNQVLILNTL